MEKKDRDLSIIGHLEELRSRIIVIVSYLVITVLLTFSFSDNIITWFKVTFCQNIEVLYYFKPLEFFFTKIRVSLILSVLLTSPMIAFQIWKFISPAMFAKERLYVKRLAFISSSLFLIGTFLALKFLFPLVLDYTQGMETANIQANISIKSVINLAGMLMLGFGLVFQLPILVFILIISNIVKHSTLSKFRPHIFVAVFILSAVLTPPDIISQLAMGIPAIILFEISLLISRLMKNKDK